jgi:hypothetical protein
LRTVPGAAALTNVSVILGLEVSDVIVSATFTLNDMIKIYFFRAFHRLIHPSHVIFCDFGSENGAISNTPSLNKNSIIYNIIEYIKIQLYNYHIRDIYI